MGTDITVVNAARVSFHKESKWETPNGYDGLYPLQNVKDLELSKKDQKLIKYLATHDHWTPFSHVVITMREKVPIFVARQRFKHMVGFTYNEISRRYVDDEPEFYEPDVWRKRAENKKQGSSDEVVEFLTYDSHIYARDYKGEALYDNYHEEIPIKEEYFYHLHSSKLLYYKMIEEGVAPEQARMVLPQSMFTEYYVTGSLAAWARAYKLRSDAHSQKEIQELADKWNQTIKTISTLKYSWEALTQ